MALVLSQVQVELREVKLSNKPDEMLKLSPKGTVPVLVLPEGEVLEESLEIMQWALSVKDPENLSASWEESRGIIDANDGEFKHHLDRYKYADRYPEESVEFHRQQGERFLALLDHQLQTTDFLLSPKLSVADIALAPFIRQWANVDRHGFADLPYSSLQRWLGKMLESKPFLLAMNKVPEWKAGEAAVVFPPNNESHEK